MVKVLKQVEILSGEIKNVQRLEDNKVSFEQHILLQFSPEWELDDDKLKSVALEANRYFLDTLAGHDAVDLANIYQRLKYAEALVELSYSQNAAALEAERLENKRIALEERRLHLYRLWNLNRYPLGNRPVYETPHIGPEIDLSKEPDLYPAE